VIPNVSLIIVFSVEGIVNIDSVQNYIRERKGIQSVAARQLGKLLGAVTERLWKYS